jgi:hypothetical protein
LALLNGCASRPAPEPDPIDVVPFILGGQIKEWVVPLQTAKIKLNNDTFDITKVDHVQLTVEGNFRGYRDGDKLTIFYKDGKPYLKVVRK